MPADFIRTVAEDGVAGGRVCLPEGTKKPELARAAVATADKGGETRVSGEGTGREEQARKTKGKEAPALSPGGGPSPHL